MEQMSAAVFDGKLRYATDYPEPVTKPGWARIRVTQAGICKTDMELMKGYKGFAGVLGHEFVGVVDRCDDAGWVGKRVIGEINEACGECEFCKKDLGRHCPNRATLGIFQLDGCMATYCILPTVNLIAVPENIPDDRAVLTEPLAAACEILEQQPLCGNERVIILGDGRLGILCAWALSTIVSNVTLIGHHPEKLALAAWRGIQTAQTTDRIKPGADLVVEATGSGQGIATAMSLCRPRGAIVLKSTVAVQGDINLSPIVINELTVLGSRCGRFQDAISMMQSFPDMPLERLITDRYPLSHVVEAFDRAAQKDAIKVLLVV
ncbi:MAG: alcohol dehydrogenase catalytic domain-containing protein [Desulfatirhabdiaceae bacterium]